LGEGERVRTRGNIPSPLGERARMRGRRSGSGKKIILQRQNRKRKGG